MVSSAILGFNITLKSTIVVPFTIPTFNTNTPMYQKVDAVDIRVCKLIQLR